MLVGLDKSNSGLRTNNLSVWTVMWQGLCPFPGSLKSTDLVLALHQSSFLSKSRRQWGTCGPQLSCEESCSVKCVCNRWLLCRVAQGWGEWSAFLSPAPASSHQGWSLYGLRTTLRAPKTSLCVLKKSQSARWHSSCKISPVL